MHRFSFLRISWSNVATVSWFVLLSYVFAVYASQIPRFLANQAGEAVTVYVTYYGRSANQFDINFGMFFLMSMLTVEWFYLFSQLLLGSLLFLRKQSSGIAALVAIAFVVLAFGQTSISGSYLELDSHYLIGHAWYTPMFEFLWTNPYFPIFEGFDAVTCILAICLFFVIPDGRFVPRWTRYVAVLWIFIVVIWFLFPLMPLNAIYGYTFHMTSSLSMGFFLTFIGIGLYAQYYRWRHASDHVTRQQLRWILLGMLLAVAAGIIRHDSFRDSQLSLEFVILRKLVSLVCIIGFSICLSIAMRKYRLWKLGNILNTTVVWALMTAIVIAIFVLLVNFFGSQLGNPRNPLLSAIATAIVTLLFQPLHNRIQRVVDRVMFGLRSEPLTMISRLTGSDQDNLTTEGLLDSVPQTVAQMLKLPYVAVELEQKNGLEMISSYGNPVSDCERIDLVYDSTLLGYLVVGVREKDTRLDQQDRQALQSVASQIAATAHIITLNKQLQNTREHLIAAREEERRRLGRDLHDDIGPKLAAHTINIGNARAIVFQDPAKADQLLSQVELEISTAVAEIRGLVHALRPPSLEQLGLLRSIHEFALRVQSSELTIDIQVKSSIPKLSAAIEVAAYRIVLEALTNVVRHSHAQHCVIKLAAATALEITIIDDGIGLSKNARSGTGMASMRERAAELGGTCHFQMLPHRGTQVHVSLPIMETANT